MKCSQLKLLAGAGRMKQHHLIITAAAITAEGVLITYACELAYLPIACDMAHACIAYVCTGVVPAALAFVIHP